MRNPLIKRIPKELKSEWHKYIVIILFMILMIGLVSGMYVGHDSMLASIDEGKEKLKLEDGSFEINKKASEGLIAGMESGEMADVRQYYIDEGMKEADEEVEKAALEELQIQVEDNIKQMVRVQCEGYGITDEQIIETKTKEALEESLESALEEAKESDEYKKTIEEAKGEAHKEVEKKVDEKWNEIAEEYGLNDESFEPVSIKIYDDFYRNENEDYDNDGTVDATVRIFSDDIEIDKAEIIEGKAPKAADEIAIDRMHADNVGVKVGDTITVGVKKLKVVGLLSYVNYLTLHESNTDLMFDAFGFDVAMMTPEGFDSLSSRVHYNYAYLYDEKPADKEKEADYAKALLKSIVTQTLVNDNEIEDFLPEYIRQASNFAPSDIEGDTTGTGILCYILIAVIAFIFAITIGNTIEKEAAVIGTLRASGYTKGELVFHYMSMPFIITLIGAVLGNILGYTLFEDVAVNLYYESYSLPACVTVWSPVALVKTTVIPLILMFFINLFVIINKLKLSPLKFLRRDLKKTKNSKARRIPSWSFLARFRLRNVFQNLPNYFVLVFGVIFIELMLCFAFGVPDSFANYREKAPSMIFADYHYMLMGSKDDNGEEITTSEKSAERFSTTSLMYPKNDEKTFREGFGSGGDEPVTVYGVIPDSRYIDIGNKLTGDDIYISSAFAKKFNIKEESIITLHEEYENKKYDFKVKGVIDYNGGVAVFMPNDEFNRVFDKKDGDFSGYFSKNEINDIDEKYIAIVITVDDITKVTRQLEHSMGSMFEIFKYVLVVLAMALIYLLTKIIIEKNENAISMVKILGFKNGEIASLYIVPTAIIVVLVSILSFVVGFFLMIYIFKVFMMSMDGWFEFYMKPVSMLLSIIYLLVGYAIVSVIDYIRIKKIPMSDALKNVE
ncbi:putative ABC transport system permease protein [Lachnospiraceae bacterium RM5]|nr:putative ABC transport system permease protein [Lachnospiraceae bacterium RM5]